MADDRSSRSSSASSRADTPLLQASTAVSIENTDDLHELIGDVPPELIVGAPPSAPSPLELRALTSQAGRAQSLTPADYRQLDLVHPPNDNLICRICLSPYVKPRILTCEHTFCEDCLDQHIQTSIRQNDYGHRAKCPTCRRTLDLTTEPYDVSRIITNMLDEMMVNCPSGSLGCQWSGQRGDVQDHLHYSCHYRMVDCSARHCQYPVMAKDVEKGCMHTDVSCEHCGERMMEIELENHQLRLCTNLVDKCHLCDADVVRRLIQSHVQNDCLKATVACPGQELGCDVKAPREHMAGHEKTCTMVKMLPVFQNMKSRQETLESENSRLRRTVEHLRSSQNAFENTINDMQTMVALPLGGAGHDNADELGNPDSETVHQMIEQHEALRNEVSRLHVAIAEAEARTNMQLQNEILRLNTEMARSEAAIVAMRTQQQWLINTRRQAIASQIRSNSTASSSTSGASRGSDTASGPRAGNVSAVASSSASSSSAPSTARRLSDTLRQETKL
ncbi:hypothetical protein IWX90DRAFT_386099 [Phyllosticta citrichinensis]|uniref:Uncharacterized protein n=1 Tax=Phyllosticta citrichinensis TaxID=1130410 RepID=A0ABR1XUC1_9PEZI